MPAYIAYICYIVIIRWLKMYFLTTFLLHVATN